MKPRYPTTGVLTQPNVVVGMSMGGILTRYALKKMEDRNIPHCTSTMITWDTPHKGANAPLGVQGAIWFRYASAAYSSSDRDDACGLREWDFLNQPAARQQLILHLGTAVEEGIISLYLKRFSDRVFPIPNSFSTYDEPIPLPEYGLKDDYACLRESLVAELETLGYPERCGRVAIASGSQTGGGSGIAAGGTMIDVNVFASITSIELDVMEMEVFADGGGSSAIDCYNVCEVYSLIGSQPGPINLALLATAKTPTSSHDSGVLFNAIFPEKNGNVFVAKNAPCSYYYGTVLQLDDSRSFFDGAPGGSRTDLMGFEHTVTKSALESGGNPDVDLPATAEFLNFLSTVSALDIEGEWSDELLFMNIKAANTTGNLQTPFDDYHAPEGNNLKHVEMDTEVVDFMNDNIAAWSSGPGDLNLTAGQIYNHADRLRLFNNTVVNDGAFLVVNGVTGSGYGGGLTSPDNSTFSASGFFGCIPTDITVRDGGEFRVGSVSSDRKGIASFYDGSVVHIEAGGTLTVAEGSRLVMESGSVLVLDEGAIIDLAGSGSEIYIAEGAEIIIEGGSVTVPSFDFSGEGHFLLADGLVFTCNTEVLNLHGHSFNDDMWVLADGLEIELPADTDLRITGAGIRYGSGSSIKVTEGGVRVFAVNFSGDNAFAALEIDSPQRNVYVSHSRFSDFTAAALLRDIGNSASVTFSSTDFIDNGYGIDAENAGTVRTFSISGCDFTLNHGAGAYLRNIGRSVSVNNCDFNGDPVLREYLYDNQITLSDNANTNNGILIENVPRLHLRSTDIRDCNVGINGVGTDEAAEFYNNITLSNQTVLEDNFIGVWTNGGKAQINGDLEPLDWGSVLTDCAKFVNNYIGIKGRDVLLQIDALENCDCTPDDYDYAANTFIKQPQSTSLFFDICFADRTLDYAVDVVTAKGNHWSTDPNIQASLPPYLIDQICLTPTIENMQIDFSEKLTDEPFLCHNPDGNDDETETDPDDDDVCETMYIVQTDFSFELPVGVVIVPDIAAILGEQAQIPGIPGGFQIEVPDVYVGALEKLKIGEYLGFLERLAILAQIPEIQLD